MNQLQIKEKRIFERIKRHPQHPWSVHINDQELITKNISDISDSGMAFHAPIWTSFTPQSVINIRILVGKEVVYEGPARIIWTQSEGSKRKTSLKAIGIQFLSPNNAISHKLTFNSISHEATYIGPFHEQLSNARALIRVTKILHLIFSLILLGALITAVVISQMKLRLY